MFEIEAKVGSVVDVFTTTGRSHTDDQLVQMALKRIIHVSGQAPRPIWEQVVAFQENLRYILKDYFERARKGERRDIIQFLRENGYENAAKAVRQSARARPQKQSQGRDQIRKRGQK